MEEAERGKVGLVARINLLSISLSRFLSLSLYFEAWHVARCASRAYTIICIYICTYMYICIYIFVYIYVYASISLYLYIYIYMYVYVTGTIEEALHGKERASTSFS